MFNSLSWQGVRNFGELKLLTKTSYLILIIVPIISGFLTNLHIAISSYNESIKKIDKKMIFATQSINNHIDKLKSLTDENHTYRSQTSPEDILNRALDKALEELKNLQRSINSLASEALINKPPLPLSLCLSFFASLMVALGHFFYQYKAPPIIKNNTLIEHIDFMQKEYNWYISDLQLIHFQNQLVNNKFGIEIPEKPSSSINEDTNSIEIKDWKIAVIRGAAKVDYLEKSIDNKPYQIASLLCYISALILILSIVIYQAKIIFCQSIICN